MNGPGNTAKIVVDPAWPTLQTFALARILVATALLLSALVFGAPTVGRATGADPAQALIGLMAYFASAAAMAAAAVYVHRRFLVQLAGQLLLDLSVITTLVALGGGMRSGFVILYLLPLAGAALMLPTSAAFFTCSIAVLSLLTDAFLRSLSEEHTETQLFQAGVYGAALFGITGLLRLLSARLAKQEQLARARGLDLQSQLEINRLVISQMEQGVVVVDATTRVRANNLAARVLLGLHRDAQLTGRRLVDLSTLRPLAEGFLRWQQSDSGRTGWSDSLIQAVEQQAASPPLTVRERQLRARFARPPSPQSGEFVIFLEDVQALEERAQHLKLAAMGRLTASIAHEIRNPLAAISHAGQLLAEDVRDPVQVRLTSILRENTLRLNRLVEDVLRVARREAPLSDEFDLAQFVSAWLEEFTRDRAVGARVIEAHLVPGQRVKFEQNHLRQVLFNLVDNALRYCTGGPGSIEIRVEDEVEGDGRVRLWVVDDGPGIAPEDRGAVFEPFFTTHLRGTGLGLYLAREFCIANQAELAYDVLRPAARDRRSGFVLRFARLRGEEPADIGFLDTIPQR
jgi:two-component system sensor histidine kinase PilS (NtrC family)